MESKNIVPLTAPKLISESIPDLYVGKYKTKSKSTQNRWFTSDLVLWESFESKVRETFTSRAWKKNEPALGFRHADEEMNKERVQCGNEATVQSRFMHHVGHFMTAVFEESLNNPCNPIVFGDYKIHGDKKIPGYDKVPDIVICKGGDPNQTPLLVLGEVKTRWMHHFEKAQNHYDLATYRKYLGKPFHKHVLCARSLTTRYSGQIAGYMHSLGIKYGFLTNYNETIFLKQEPPHDPGKSNRWALWHSRVIKHDTEWMSVPPNAHPFTYKGKVTLRECFLHFIKLAVGESRIENKMDSQDWVTTLSSHSRVRYESLDESKIKTLTQILPPAEPWGRTPPWAESSLDIWYSQTKRKWYYEYAEDDTRGYIDEDSFGFAKDDQGQWCQYFLDDGERVPYTLGEVED